jgi:hypothetical protein
LAAQIMAKSFRLSADQFKPLATNRGGCIATDMITVDGHKVEYMYREPPSNDMDSGWRFMSGFESQDYMDDPSKHDVYDINTVANYDPDIVDWLDAPVGASFERLTPDGDLVPVEYDPPEWCGPLSPDSLNSRSPIIIRNRRDLVSGNHPSQDPGT